MGDLDFVQVGELAKGIARAEMPLVDDLAGRSMQLDFEDGSAARIVFGGPRELSWEMTAGKAVGSSGEESCWAVSPRPGIYLVDWLSSVEPATSVDLVLDFNSGSATVLVGRLPAEAEVARGTFALANEGAELTFVRVAFLRAAIDKPFSPQDHAHAPTDEMVGKRVMYVYGPTEAYEHIYLNDKLYSWQCLKGIEKGLADTDRCHSYKLGEQLYLFVWREKIVPTLGVVVADWQAMRSVGKIFGYESNDFGKLMNVPIAAEATLLNVTAYPGL